MAEEKPTTFEGAMERLERIVEQMEGDALPLEEMLERYEEGTRLAALCSQKLASAEKRIEIIAKKAAGKTEIVEFDADSAENAEPEPTKTPRAPRAHRVARPQTPDPDVSLF